MKLYRIFLVVLLIAAVGCGAWYFYGVLRESGDTSNGTLVNMCDRTGSARAA
jgi:hypothetical protein